MDLPTEAKFRLVVEWIYTTNCDSDQAQQGLAGSLDESRGQKIEFGDSDVWARGYRERSRTRLISWMQTDSRGRGDLFQSWTRVILTANTKRPAGEKKSGLVYLEVAADIRRARERILRFTERMDCWFFFSEKREMEKRIDMRCLCEDTRAG